MTKQFEPYRDSDFYRMLWNPLGADVTGNHLTRVGTTMPFETTHAFHRCDRQFALSCGKILKSGGDILKTAVDAARWDAEGMHANPYNWHVFRHGGSPEFLKRVIAQDPQVAVRFQSQTEVRGVRLDRYNPLRSY